MNDKRQYINACLPPFRGHSYLPRRHLQHLPLSLSLPLLPFSSHTFTPRHFLFTTYTVPHQIMGDYAPPAGPPPPKVPAGWKAVFNAEYKEWFYVNTFTKQSQWDKPTEPVYAPGEALPSGAPPGYDHSASKPTGPEKSGNPYNSSTSGDDEALARKLQAEEEAKAGASTTRGASDSYYGAGQNAPYGQQNNTPAYGQNNSTSNTYGQGQPGASSSSHSGDQKRGFFSKLTDKLGGSQARPPQQGYGGGYPSQGYPPQQQHYGQPYGQQGYPPQQGYGGYPPQQGYYPQQGGYQQPPKRQGGGMGGAGGMMLGAGAGLVGGALLMDAIDDREDEAYQDGYDAGQDNDCDDFGGDE